LIVEVIVTYRKCGLILHHISGGFGGSFIRIKARTRSIPDSGHKMYKRKSAYATDYKKKKKAKTTPKNNYSRALPSVRSGWSPVSSPFSQELNFIDRSISPIVSATGSVDLLNGVPRGTGPSDRLGIKTKVASIQWDIKLFQDVASQSNFPFIYLIFDAQPNGVLPNIADIINVTGFSNLGNRDRFVTLRKWQPALVGPINGSVVGTGDSTVWRDTGYMKLKECYSIYSQSSSGGAISDMQSGAIYLVTYSATTAGTTDTNSVISTRIRYVA